LVSQEIIRLLSQQLCLHSYTYTSASDTHTCDRQTDGRDCLTDRTDWSCSAKWTCRRMSVALFVAE